MRSGAAMVMPAIFLFFFFQAEDGIRDYKVTGVQTCALPISQVQWIEDRFWVWVHYIAVKIARGELFEAIDALEFVRARVLGPLILSEAGGQPNGVRRVEQTAPGRGAALG